MPLSTIHQFILIQEIKIATTFKINEILILCITHGFFFQRKLMLHNIYQVTIHVNFMKADSGSSKKDSFKSFRIT